MSPGPPATPGGEPPRGNRNTVIGLVVAGIVVLVAAGVALLLVRADRDDTTAARPDGTTESGAIGSWSEDEATPRDQTTTPTDEPPDGGALPDPIVTPEGLGDDPLLDALATACFTGDMQSCDDLFDRSDVGSDYETYGDSCAGRQPPGTLVYCTGAFPQS